ncbi:MAG: Winged helix-turn-helix DNA-binding [Candidatus Woesearchaeota archaeon]|nr:Winged helix-turn-helix DNA-binding [Candidatus Woesearchaeota archaeon]
MKVYEILADLVDDKIMRILELFAKNPNSTFYLKQISDKTDVSLTSVFRILKDLVEKGYIEEKVYGPQKLYSLSKLKKGKALLDIFSVKTNVIEIMVEYLSKVPGIERIFLYGKQKQNSANIIIIGDSLDIASIESIIARIKHEYDFDIKYITLSNSQFEQMTKIGMYSEQRTQVYP